MDRPIRIQSFADFERTFGGLWRESVMSQMVQHYFLNGGTDAIIVRVVHKDDPVAAKNASKATCILHGLALAASSEGDWGNNLWASVDHINSELFNLTIKECADPDCEPPVAIEVFRNVSVNSTSPRFVAKVIEQDSQLVDIDDQVTDPVPDTRPDAGKSAFYRRPRRDSSLL